MARNISQMLPAGWNAFSPQQKVNWFNNNNVTVDELITGGVPSSDISYMFSIGYQPPEAAKTTTQAEQDLIDLYRSVLGREPDAEGLEYWKSVVGPTLEENERSWWMGGAQDELSKRQALEEPVKVIEPPTQKALEEPVKVSETPIQKALEEPVYTPSADELQQDAIDAATVRPDEAAPVVADSFTLAKKGTVNKDAAATLKDQLTQQAGAYKVQHKASFSKEQDKIISDLAEKLSAFGVTDLSDITQGTRMVVEDVYDPNYFGDGGPDVIGQKLVEVSTVVNKRTGEEIPMNKLNNAAGSGFTWYNLQFVSGVPVFYASKEETGWNAFKQEQLPTILQFAKFIPGVTPFAIAAEAALALDEGKEIGDVIKDTAVKVVLHEAAAYVTNSPSMFESSYYDAAGNLLSDIGEDIGDIIAGEGTVGADPNYGTPTAPPKTPTFTDVTSGVGLDTGVADTALETVTITGSPVTPPVGTNLIPGGITTLSPDSTKPTQEVEVTGKKTDEPITPPPTGGITTLSPDSTKPTQEVEVTGKKTDEPTTPPPTPIQEVEVTGKKTDEPTTPPPTPIQEVEVTGSKEDIERDAREEVISGPLTTVTTGGTTDVEVTGKKPEEEKPPGPLTTGIEKIIDGSVTDLTADEIKALVGAGLLVTSLVADPDIPTIPTTTIDTEAINTLRPGFTVDLTPTTPGVTTTTTTTPGQQVYPNLGINTGRPTTPPPAVPTTGIGSLPVPTYKPPPFLGAQAPGASRITPPVLTADPTLTQADFDFAAAEIARQQAALPPIVQVAPSSPFESGLAKGTTVAKRAGGIVALRRGGMPLAFAYGGMTGPVNQPRMLSGGGDGMSDSIPATIDGTQPARLADGEFVIPADVVADIGNGSSSAGAKQLYAMMDRVRQSRHGTTKQPPEVNMNKVLPV